MERKDDIALRVFWLGDGLGVRRNRHNRCLDLLVRSKERDRVAIAFAHLLAVRAWNGLHIFEDKRLGEPERLAKEQMGIGTSNALFRREEEYDMDVWVVKGASRRSRIGGIGDFSGDSSTRGAMFRSVLATLASEGQREVGDSVR
jgi:hypothetical protein